MKKQGKNFAAAFIGTALEFYDFALFGLLAPIFSRLFFPKEDPIAALIASYCIFAAGFLIRPLGGVVFGYVGDTFGRKRAMVISIIAMMVPTSLIGFLPTYDQIGLLAPIALSLCRLLQGLCAGGEFSGAAIFVIEHAHENRKYLSGSLVTASSVVGMLAASSMASFCALETMPVWGWRIPFLLSIPIGLLGFYIRKNTQETAIFNNAQKIQKNEAQSFFSIFKNNLISLLITFGIGCFIGILYYVPFVFMGHYHTLVTSLSTSTTLFVITLGLVVYMLCICFAGYMADKIGPQKIMMLTVCATIVLAYPAFWLIRSGDFSLIIQGELILSVLAGMFVGPANGLTASLFSVKERCRGVAFSLSLGISLFGGLTPLLLVYIISQTQILMWPAAWMMFGALIAAFSILTSKKTQKEISLRLKPENSIYAC
ncbi:MAG: MFS transporter [Alphaproteobacteria bacterium]|nr:MFS transporter [Alphaproteobacteria bacterium]